MSHETPMHGVVVKQLSRHTDARGWLLELFRSDELPAGYSPVMGYISVTHPGVSRGPHEHVHQTDGFAFLSGRMKLYLWEYRDKVVHEPWTLEMGEDNPVFVTVPPGVVHAYKNIGSTDAMVLNFPDQLYAGKGREEPVDEIRHEADFSSPFQLD